MQRIQTIDSHTGGEPTRVIIDGGPDLGAGSFSDRFAKLQNEFDWFRSAVVNEPRGSEPMVGALLCKPDDPACAAGVVFFNTRGFLGMCGHGLIGLVVTLRRLGHVELGSHRIQTPAGIVTADLNEDGSVAVENVPSFRKHENVHLTVPSFGDVRGDIAYGGNWFYLVETNVGPLTVDRSRILTAAALEMREALAKNGVTGADSAEIDHVEFFSPPHDPKNDSRNFVLCPGGAYDRSPCGTGTSAKLACLAADGKLAAETPWRQESILGSVFACSYRDAPETGKIIPTIRGTAHIMAESTLVLDPSDPFSRGIRG